MWPSPRIFMWVSCKLPQSLPVGELANEYELIGGAGTDRSSISVTCTSDGCGDLTAHYNCLRGSNLSPSATSCDQDSSPLKLQRCTGKHTFGILGISVFPMFATWWSKGQSAKNFHVRDNDLQIAPDSTGRRTRGWIWMDRWYRPFRYFCDMHSGWLRWPDGSFQLSTWL